MRALIPGIIVCLSTLTGCGLLAPTYSEKRDPASGHITERSFRGDINTLMTGNLSNRDSTGTGSILGVGGGGRGTVITTTAATEFADNSQPTLVADASSFKFYGTASRSQPIAAFGRSVTGVLAELRKWAVRIAGIEAWKDTELSDDATSLGKHESDNATEQTLGLSRDKTTRVTSREN